MKTPLRASRSWLDPESHDEAMDEDPYVRETGEILVDYMDLLRENQVARKG